MCIKHVPKQASHAHTRHSAAVHPNAAAAPVSGLQLLGGFADQRVEAHGAEVDLVDEVSAASRSPARRRRRLYRLKLLLTSTRRQQPPAPMTGATAEKGGVESLASFARTENLKRSAPTNVDLAVAMVTAFIAADIAFTPYGARARTQLARKLSF